MVRTMNLLEFAAFQDLESHKLESISELVRLNEKGPPFEAFNLSQMHELRFIKRWLVSHLAP